MRLQQRDRPNKYIHSIPTDQTVPVPGNYCDGSDRLVHLNVEDQVQGIAVLPYAGSFRTIMDNAGDCGGWLYMTIKW